MVSSVYFTTTNSYNSRPPEVDFVPNIKGRKYAMVVTTATGVPVCVCICLYLETSTDSVQTLGLISF